MDDARRERSRAVGAYLLVCALCIATMVVGGGLVRLSRSGLSIVRWEPITGILPPIGEAEWAEELARYRSSPEGRLVNASLDADGFRRIYLVEWAHRLLGRIVGVVVLLPLLLPRLRRRMSRRLLLSLGGLVALFVAQGVLGWLMVASGLVDVPHVSPFRLASHLLVAFVLYAALLRLALDELDAFAAPVDPSDPAALVKVRRSTTLLGALVFVTVGFGALVAGLHAGTLFPTFPDYGGELLPRGAFDGLPLSLVGNPVTVHVVHRSLGLVVLGASFLLAGIALRADRRAFGRPAVMLAGASSVQVGLGAATVLAHVPLPLASLHQANALLVLASLVALGRASRVGRQRPAGGEEGPPEPGVSLPKSRPITWLPAFTKK